MNQKDKSSFLKNIGIEIECPFSFYYPDLWEKYFSSGKRKYYDFSDDEKESLRKELDVREPLLLDKLEKITKDLGLKRGRDKYWEFIFPAQKGYESLLYKIKTLIDKGALPNDTPLPFQITVGDVKGEYAHAILFFLEREFLTEERIKEAFTEKDYLTAWGRKGEGGVVTKYKTQLEYGDETASELRTLKVSMSDVKKVLSLLKSLLEKEPKNVIDEAKREVTSLGLPWKNWGEKEFRIFGENLKN